MAVEILRSETVNAFIEELDRLDAMATLHQAEREGGDIILLNAIRWHVEGRADLTERLRMQAKYGSIMETYVGYRQ